jgi:predicted tellurium resistance membrane protein TerC
MSAAVLTAVAVMLFFITPVSNFIERHPTVKMLALAFLLLIGMILVADKPGAIFSQTGRRPFRAAACL